MILSDREIKKRANLKKIVQLFRSSGYLPPKDIEDKLPWPIRTPSGKPRKIPHSTLHGYLQQLYDIGVIKEYKDGWAWVDYSEDEDKIKNAYEDLKKKFFGEPPLKAVSREIKETPEKTKELLSKYIDYYSEPTEEEMAKSAGEILRHALWGGWMEHKFHDRNFKKWAIDEDVIELGNQPRNVQEAY